MNKPDKGLENGSCNRSACQAPGAKFYNHSARAWYCQRCAEMIQASCLHFGNELCFSTKELGHVNEATYWRYRP